MRGHVNEISVSLVVLGCVLAGGLLGFLVNTALPKDHLSDHSKDSVKQTVGVLSALTALVLGLLIATAKTSYDAKNDGLIETAADVILLDQALAQYGPETGGARKLLRDSTSAKLKEIWHRGDAEVAGKAAPGRRDPLEEIQIGLRDLTPQTAAQLELRSRSLAISADLVKTQWIILARSGGTIPGPFLVVLAFWLALTFAGLGLLAPRNGTVIAAGIATALAVAAAVLLILELDTPYGGVIAISDAPLRLALEHLGR
jgi:hypothetical protein